MTVLGNKAPSGYLCFGKIESRRCAQRSKRFAGKEKTAYWT
jgi:hypothetical protein